MPRCTDPNALRTPPPNAITKLDAAPLCGLALTAFVGSYWVWKKKLGLPDPVKVLVNGSRTLFYDRDAVQRMAEAIHRRGRKTTQNGEWMDNCRRMRQLMQNVTEEREANNPALRRANQTRAARHIRMPLDRFLQYDAEGLPLPMEYFIRMQSLLSVGGERVKRRKRGVSETHVAERP